MSFTYVQYVADGITSEFDVPFPFVNRTHVKVFLNGVPPILPVVWVGDSRIKLTDNIAAGTLVEVRRETPLGNRLVDFQNGSVLTEEELDTAVNQVFYIQQELRDLYDRGLAEAIFRVANANGIFTVNPEDAVAELANLVLEQQVVADLRQAISDIDLNADAITNQALSIGGLRTDHDALVAYVDTLTGGDVGSGLATLIQNETTARIDADTALVDTIALIGAKSSDSLSFILDLDSVKVSPTETLATRFNVLAASTDDALALIQSEETARIAEDTALASSISSLGTRMTNAEAGIVNEASARAAGDAAEATQRNALAARVTTAEGAITANSAAITNESTARANADSAVASQLSLLGAQNGLGTAWLLDLSKVMVDNSTSLGTRLTGIDTQIGNVSATVTNESAARVNGDNALASSIATLTTTVNNNSATVSTFAASINGLNARYGVSLDVNGYVTGFVQNNNGSSGNFTIIADRFAIVTPGVAPQVPFEVSGGIVRIKEAAIGTLNVGKLTSGALGANITQNGDWLVGAGKIIWDNGSFMKVTGVGFGSSNQFIEWFGPKMAISSCTEANAIQYLKTNGDAYFGGSLSVGVLKNAAQSTDLGAYSTVTLGPFGSNGNPIQVVTSYSVTSSYTNDYGATNTGLTQWESAVSTWGGTVSAGGSASGSKTVTCNVVVNVTKNGAPFATLNITSGTGYINGVRPEPGDAPGYLKFTLVVAGSITSTDNAGGTTDRTFVASLVDRTNAIINTPTVQRVGLVTTEA